MGNLDFSANADQLKELAAYMASQINVPTIGIGGGYAPIGTINFFDATVAPQDWLACDGSIYNIADYPQLAEWYATQHGASNFYGGNGTTTFAVPDLQGEFLRGTGTNGHENQGSGANVGVHQDGTYVPKTGTKSNGGVFYKQANDWDGTINLDNITLGTQYGGANVTWTNMTPQDIGGTTRPTNTSFLICVKAVVAGEVYSTEERVVGTWIDGKPIYQKTFSLTFPVVTTDGTYVADNTIIDDLNIEQVVSQDGYWVENGYSWVPLNFVSDNGQFHTSVYVWKDTTTNHMKLKYGTDRIRYGNQPFVVTLRYTKTTDG